MEAFAEILPEWLGDGREICSSPPPFPLKIVIFKAIAIEKARPIWHIIHLSL
jgi:hypothetical protein